MNEDTSIHCAIREGTERKNYTLSFSSSPTVIILMEKIKNVLGVEGTRLLIYDSELLEWKIPKTKYIKDGCQTLIETNADVFQRIALSRESLLRYSINKGVPLSRDEISQMWNRCENSKSSTPITLLKLYPLCAAAFIGRIDLPDYKTIEQYDDDLEYQKQKLENLKSAATTAAKQRSESRYEIQLLTNRISCRGDSIELLESKYKKRDLSHQQSEDDTYSTSLAVVRLRSEYELRLKKQSVLYDENLRCASLCRDAEDIKYRLSDQLKKSIMRLAHAEADCHHFHKVAADTSDRFIRASEYVRKLQNTPVVVMDNKNTIITPQNSFISPIVTPIRCTQTPESLTLDSSCGLVNKNTSPIKYNPVSASEENICESFQQTKPIVAASEEITKEEPSTSLDDSVEVQSEIINSNKGTSSTGTSTDDCWGLRTSHFDRTVSYSPALRNHFPTSLSPPLRSATATEISGYRERWKQRKKTSRFKEMTSSLAGGAPLTPPTPVVNNIRWCNHVPSVPSLSPVSLSSENDSKIQHNGSEVESIIKEQLLPSNRVPAGAHRSRRTHVKMP